LWLTLLVWLTETEFAALMVVLAVVDLLVLAVVLVTEVD
jgi:hypothetical protein